MGQYLVESALIPDLVLCSTALRARATWDLAARAFGKQAPPAAFSRDLYHAAPSELLLRIQMVEDEVQRLLLVGHNPGMELLAQRLMGTDPDEDAIENMEIKYPTAGLACFQVTMASWENLQPDGTRLVTFITPAELEQRSSQFGSRSSETV